MLSLVFTHAILLYTYKKSTMNHDAYYVQLISHAQSSSQHSVGMQNAKFKSIMIGHIIIYFELLKAFLSTF